jgi:hypothetical protein
MLHTDHATSKSIAGMCPAPELAVEYVIRILLLDHPEAPEAELRAKAVDLLSSPAWTKPLSELADEVALTR